MKEADVIEAIKFYLLSKEVKNVSNSTVELYEYGATVRLPMEKEEIK